ncbi:MAG: hypothetical protein NTV72_02615 [Candidatus Taylorbacteria bacterium]|nr:hypothetical protein [Candidatus Taylorbacteria bacterium]
MKNWSTDTKELEKDVEKLVIWKLEQLINFGLDGSKLKITDLKKYWNVINIDPSKRKFLATII